MNSHPLYRLQMLVQLLLFAAFTIQNIGTQAKVRMNNNKLAMKLADAFKLDTTLKMVLFVGGCMVLAVMCLVVIIESVKDDGPKTNSTGVQQVAAIEGHLLAGLKRQNCTPQEELSGLRAKMLHTDNMDTKFKLAGYLELIEGRRISYLPLDFVAIERERLYDNSSLILLVGGCVSLEIRYALASAREAASSQFQFQSIEIHKINERLRIARKLCTLPADTFGLAFEDKLHYSCRQTRIRACTRLASDKRNQTAANLILTSFALELRTEQPHKNATKAHIADDGCQLASSG